MYGLFILPFLFILSIPLQSSSQEESLLLLSEIKENEKKEAFLKQWLEKKPKDVHALFNLALLKLEKKENLLSLGILRRALYLDPGFKETYEILRENSSLSVLDSLKQFVFKILPYSYLIYIHLVLFFLSFFLFLFQRIGFVFYTSVCFFALFSIFVVDKIGSKIRPQATVIVQNLKVNSLPQANFASLFELKAGQRVRLLKQKENWIQIKTNKGEIGWVEKKDIFKDQV